MFKESNKFEKFESKVWLSSPTMHGPEIEYVKEAYETNWMSTVGKNINEVEKLACEYIGCKYAIALSAGTASLHLASPPRFTKSSYAITSALINPFSKSL